MKLPNIEYKGDLCKFIENSDNPNECISYYKDREYFDDIVAYTNFVKKCEYRVRTSNDYKAFISYVKNVLGINFCQVSSNIFDTDATIEMHHGPILTLFDYCSIVTDAFIANNKKISTFRIADQVLQEHFDLNVQVIMVAVTNHEAIHNRDIFINVSQGIGNLNKFIEKYKDYLTDDQKYKIWHYIYSSKNNDSFQNGVLDINNLSKMIQL